MRAYAQLGRYKDMQQDFEKLKKGLRKELKTELQEETVRLYESLRK
jgi:hypothetical protein